MPTERLHHDWCALSNPDHRGPCEAAAENKVIHREARPKAGPLVPTAAPSYLGNPHDHPIWEELATALQHAMSLHPSMNSAHEGHSVIREEMDELWEHVRADTGCSAKARKEAIQIAAMGLRYALDLCEDPNAR